MATAQDDVARWREGDVMACIAEVVADAVENGLQVEVLNGLTGLITFEKCECRIDHGQHFGQIAVDLLAQLRIVEILYTELGASQRRLEIVEDAARVNVRSSINFLTRRCSSLKAVASSRISRGPETAMVLVRVDVEPLGGRRKLAQRTRYRSQQENRE